MGRPGLKQEAENRALKLMRLASVIEQCDQIDERLATAEDEIRQVRDLLALISLPNK